MYGGTTSLRVGAHPRTYVMEPDRASTWIAFNITTGLSPIPLQFEVTKHNNKKIPTAVYLEKQINTCQYMQLYLPGNKYTENCMVTGKTPEK